MSHINKWNRFREGYRQEEERKMSTIKWRELGSIGQWWTCVYKKCPKELTLVMRKKEIWWSDQLCSYPGPEEALCIGPSQHPPNLWSARAGKGTVLQVQSIRIFTTQGNSKIIKRSFRGLEADQWLAAVKTCK